MQRLIVLGTTAESIALSFCNEHPDCQVTSADSFNTAREIMAGEADHILVVSRDFTGLSESDLSELCRIIPLSSLIWPPDAFIGPVIRTLLESTKKTAAGDQDMCGLQGARTHATENDELKKRVNALEGVVRSLLSALSQYEPAAEAYADHEDAWEMILSSVPSAEVNPEDADHAADEEEDGEDYEE
jgi:hypothetical protein